MTHSLYLDMGTLSGGITSTQFPLDRLHLCWLLPFSRTEVLLPCKVGEEGLETYCHLQEFLWDSLRGGTPSFWSHLPVSSPCQLLLCHWKRAPRLREGQTIIPPVPRQREGWASTHSLNSYRTTIRPEFNWNMSSSRRHRNWPKGVSISKPNRPRGMQGGRHRLSIKQMPPSRRCFCKQVWWRPSNYCLGVSLWLCLSAT